MLPKGNLYRHRNKVSLNKINVIVDYNYQFKKFVIYNSCFKQYIIESFGLYVDATIRMRQTDTRTRTFRRQTSSSRSRRNSTYRRPSTNPDVQVSMLPDLSELESDEQTSWEQIMQIKNLPIPMSEKKHRKIKMQVCIMNNN